MKHSQKKSFKAKNLFAFYLAMALFSCTYENESIINDSQISLTEEEFISIANDNPVNLSEGEVLAMVNGFSNSLGNKTRSIIHPLATISGMYRIGGVQEKSTRGGCSDSISIYKVSLKTGEREGYAVVSADSRSAGILAYVENGIFEKKDSTGAGLMLMLAEATTISEINRKERLKAELREKTLKKVASSIGKEKVTYDEIRDLIKIEGVRYSNNASRSSKYDTPLTQIISLMPKNGGAVLKTEWSQKNPYNLLLPVSYEPTFHSETHYPMGCAIAAGVQTLAAIAPNMTIDGTAIDWAFVTKKAKLKYEEYMGGDYDEAMMVSKVVKHMYEETGTVPIIDENFKYEQYDDPNIPCIASGSTSVSKLIEYLNRYVSCGTYYKRYAPDPLLNTINANRKMTCVAIMGGTRSANAQNGKASHAWVIDGYAICEKASREILRDYDLYFHANMGWAGRDNGFYKVNADTSIDFDTALGKYNLNFWEITEIHKK